jgi:hypothetical protein
MVDAYREWKEKKLEEMALSMHKLGFLPEYVEYQIKIIEELMDGSYAYGQD